MDWQPIETAPRDGRRGVIVSALDEDGEQLAAFVRWRDGGWECSDGMWPDFEPTHWIELKPLPAPPKEAE